jgi:uncharacterized membrane protein HdeD (DUF308 family)
MLALMAKNWWLVAIRGVAAIAFGILTILMPSLTLLALVYLFAAYAFVDGVSSIYAAVRAEPETRGHGWTFVFWGVVGVIAGVGAFLWPGLTALTLLYIVAAWAIVTGVTEIIVAIRLRREIEGEWLMALGGVASIGFGALLIIAPGTGLLSVLLLVGSYAIIFGGILLALAWRLRSWHAQGAGGTSAARSA